MADILLVDVFGIDSIDWAGGYDLQAMNERRQAYIGALRLADSGDCRALLAFVAI